MVLGVFVLDPVVRKGHSKEKTLDQDMNEMTVNHAKIE